jgi:glutamate dehydrogenase/leucine dehydrogenase
MGSNGTFSQRLLQAQEEKKKKEADAELFKRLSSMEEQLSFLKQQGESSKQTVPTPGIVQPTATVGQRQAGLRINQDVAPSRLRRMNRAM